jgi:hypothetical protein
MLGLSVNEMLWIVCLALEWRTYSSARMSTLVLTTSELFVRRY